MTPWTDSACRAFDAYCSRARETLGGKPVDADEVLDDLRRHIERLWARDEVLRLMTSREYAAAAALAAQRQVVTPSSGAVGLQTRQQFEQHGLTPADPTTVPSVPEPAQTWLLLLTGALFLFVWKKWRVPLWWSCDS